MGTLASFSSRGPAPEGLQKPDIAAPGSNIPSVRASGGYTTMSGTSMASPHLAGAVALLQQAHPELQHDAKKTMDILRQSATPIPSDECNSPQEHPNYGFGWGVLNVLAAHELATEM